MTKAETPELFMEIPPYQSPSAKPVLLKLWLRMKGFLYEAVPMIIAGVFLANLMDISGITGKISSAAKPLLKTLLGLPPETAGVMILGFLRKDISIALLEPFSLSAPQLVTASVFLALYLPCIASFFTMSKELGLKDAMKVTALGFSAALIFAASVHFIIT